MVMVMMVTVTLHVTLPRLSTTKKPVSLTDGDGGDDGVGGGGDDGGDGDGDEGIVRVMLGGLCWW
jgi:hypothetical protein